MTANPGPKFTDLEMEAALCAWEHLIEQRETPTFKPMFDALGSSGMRLAAIHAGAIALAVYEHMEARNISFSLAYDFSFVPAVLDRLDWTKLIEHRLYAGQPYEPDHKAIFDQIREAMPTDFHEEDPAEEWTRRSRAAAQRLWSYPDLISDHPDAADRARADGESPEAFAKALGEDLDLIPADVWKTGL